MRNMFHKLSCLFGLLLIFQVGNVKAQKVESLQGLENYIEKYLKDWNAVGVAVAVVKDSQLVYSAGFGYRDREKKTPVDAHTLFAIGSSTKAFTATGVCQLAEDGALSLDKPVKEFLPDFVMHDDYSTQNLSVRDLLCHRSGLPRHDFAWYASGRSRQNLYQGLRYLEPNVSLRERWQYQNLMFMTAGILIEKASGQTWEDYTRMNLLAPLEMDQANFSVEAMQKSDNYALPYEYDLKKKKINKMDFRNIDAIGPAGSINASVSEMGNWLIMQLNDGRFKGKEVIGSSFLKETHTPQMIMSTNRNKEVFYQLYGLGWMITSYRGHTRIAHGGNIDGFSADVALYPDDNVGIVVLANQNGSPLPSIVRNAIADRLLELDAIDWNQRRLDEVEKMLKNQQKQQKQGAVGKVEGTQPSHALSDYAGKYQHPGYGSLEVLHRNDSLILNHPVGEIPLSHFHYDVFMVEMGPLSTLKISFEYNTQGEIIKMNVPIEPGLDHPIVFERKYGSKEVAKETLEAYVGEYVMGRATVKIYLKNGKLHMFVPGQPEYLLSPIKEHLFRLENIEGFRAEFIMEKGKAKSLISHQPNGSFEIPRKK